MLERRYAPLRSGSGRILAGTAVRYGEVARLPWGLERFEPGAFQPLGDIRLDVMHTRARIIARTDGGGLALEDGPDALRVRAEPERTREAEDALQLVRRGVLRGLSVEFRALAERMAGGVRIIERAVLAAVSVVDNPAYPSSVAEVRRGGGSGLGGSFRYGSLRVRSNEGRRRKVKVRAGAFRHSLRDKKREISLQVGGDPGKLLASRRAGNLHLEDAEDAIRFGVDRLPETTYVADVRAQLDAGLVLGVEPTYRVAPVPNAVKLIPEGRYLPGLSAEGPLERACLSDEANTEGRADADVLIEEVLEAVLFGLEIRARPAYPEPDVSRTPQARRLRWLYQ